MRLIKVLQRLYRRFQLGMENPEILIHGFRSEESSYWRKRGMQDRIDYAICNPWVLQYDFGHLELIQKQLKRLV